MKQRLKRCMAIFMALMICFTTVIPSNLTVYAAGSDAVDAVPYAGADDEDEEVTTESSKKQDTVEAATTEAVTEEQEIQEEEPVSSEEEPEIEAGDVSEEYLDYDDYFGTYTKLTVKVYTGNNITYFVVVRIVLSFFEKGELSCVQLKRKWIIIYFIAESREGWMIKRYEHIRTI